MTHQVSSGWLISLPKKPQWPLLGLTEARSFLQVTWAQELEGLSHCPLFSWMLWQGARLEIDQLGRLLASLWDVCAAGVSVALTPQSWPLVPFLFLCSFFWCLWICSSVACNFANPVLFFYIRSSVRVCCCFYLCLLWFVMHPLDWNAVKSF